MYLIPRRVVVTVALAALVIPAGAALAEGKSSEACVTAGCSGELCISQAELDQDPGYGTFCVFQSEFACLIFSRCGHYGPNGSCGWQETPEQQACLYGIAVERQYQLCPVVSAPIPFDPDGAGFGPEPPPEVFIIQ